jgi:outer membrane protein assembly factor BamB
MAESQGPNTGQDGASDRVGAATNGPPAWAPSGTTQTPSDALPPSPTLATEHRPSLTAVVGGGAGVAGGSLAIVGSFLPWVALVAVASIGCRGPYEVVTVALSAWNVAQGNAGLAPALATWLLFVLVLLVIIYAIRALANQRLKLRRARVMLGATGVALVDVGLQSYRWATNALQASGAPGVHMVLASAFQGFGSGLWVMVCGLLAALTGGAVLHGGARSPGRKLPLPETTLAVASLLALVGSGALAAGLLSPPSLAAMTIACHRSSATGVASPPASVYATAGDTVYALRPDDGVLRWRCRDSFVNLQTAGPPALADGTLYVAALDGTVFAIRTGDGTLLWHRRVIAKGQPPLDWGTFGAPALIAAGGALYGSDGTGGVFALRAADGAVLWHNTAPLQTAQTETPLVVADGVVYGTPGNSPCSGGQSLFALDAHTGALLWRGSAPVWGRTAFAVGGGRTYDEETDSSATIITVYLTARAASDGTVLWRYPVAAESLEQGACPAVDIPPLAFAVADGVVYLQSDASVQSPGPFRPVIRALRASDGTVLWSYATGLSSTTRDGYGGNGITVANRAVYAAINAPNAVEMYAIGAADGSLLWHARPYPNALPDHVLNGHTPIDIVVADGTAYTIAVSRNLAAIDVRDGSVRWGYSPADPSGALAHLPFTGTPLFVVSGGVAYLAGNQLYALDTRDGSVRWQLAAPPTSVPPQSIIPAFSAPTLGP